MLGAVTCTKYHGSCTYIEYIVKQERCQMKKGNTLNEKEWQKLVRGSTPEEADKTQRF